MICGLLFNLSSDNEKETSPKGDIPVIESLNDIDNANCIGGAAAEGGASIGEDRDQDVLLDVKGARVEGKLGGAKAGQAELGCGQDLGHEAADGQRGHLDCDNADDERLRPVVVEGVEEREKHA